MEYFYSIKDSDIFENPLPEPEIYIGRPTVKGFVFDNENKVALLWHPDEAYGLLPGGGIEQGESEEQAFIRECKEEIGCEIQIDSKLGTAVQFRAKDGRKFETYFYVAHVMGEKDNPTTTQEDELLIEIKWMTIDELQDQFKKQITFPSSRWYQTQFNSHTHYAALRKFLGTE